MLCESVAKEKRCSHRHPNANTYLVLQSCLTVSLDARIQSGVLRAFDDVELSHHLRFIGFSPKTERRSDHRYSHNSHNFCHMTERKFSNQEQEIFVCMHTILVQQNHFFLIKSKAIA